ncbi:MAG: beta-N-acetylhexosaminidase [Pseudomonadota bacterium]
MPKALITDLEGLTLSDAEARWLEDDDPLGIILFARNIDTPEQVAKLTGDFRAVVGRDDAPVMVDQEGGRVARLRQPHFWDGVAAGRLGALADDDAAEAVFLANRIMADDMARCGIDVDCAPCLDLRLAGADNVIGDRAFDADPERVTVLGRAAAEGLAAGGVQPIIKHMPGYGRVQADPHVKLPVIDASLEELQAADLVPFKALRGQAWGMTAHAVYSAIDPARPATLSPIVISEVIRGAIGFDGVLVTDALDMEALSGSHAERAMQCLEAGCDIAMHCNAPLDVRRAVSDAVPDLSGEAKRRLSIAGSSRPAPASGFDRAQAIDRLGSLMGEAIH